MSADTDSKKLVLARQGTNEVVYWSPKTLQWNSGKDLAGRGKPVTPEEWSKGLNIRVLAVQKNGQLMAEKIILQQGQEALSEPRTPKKS